MWQNFRSSLLKMQQINSDLTPEIHPGQQISPGGNTSSSDLKSKLHPFLRRIKLARGETKLINYLRDSFDQLPEQIKKRGVLNHTKDGLWSIILPDAGFRHPQFINMGKALYKDYEDKVMLFVKQYQPVILSNAPVYLENYWPVAQCDYMGETYTMWPPSN